MKRNLTSRHQSLSYMSFEEIDEQNLENHIYDLYTQFSTPNRLGFVARNNQVEVQLKNPSGAVCREFTVKQSLQQLSSSIAGGTTGFVCWTASVAFVEWLLYDPRNPFYHYFRPPTLPRLNVIVELGSGTSGIVAGALAGFCHHFVASDQKQVFKLLRSNLEENLDKKCRVDVVEFDWEEPECGAYNIDCLVEKDIDMIVACDVIYNDYLATHFLNAVMKIMLKDTVCLVAMQMRDELVVECFLRESLKLGLKLSFTPTSAEGYIVYCLKLP